jgi:hypothetical protein
MAKKKVTKKTAKKKVVKKVEPTFPRFQFTGPPSRYPVENPPSTTFCGLEFQLDGKPVTVRDPAVAAKLRGNSHFKES